MVFNVLLVLTSHSDLADTGMKTGWYLPEVAHPYHVFSKEKVHVQFASPKGGAAPMDPGSCEAFKADPICKEFLDNSEVMNLIKNTIALKDVNSKDYQVIFYAGGHGPMFDLPDNAASNQLACNIYESGGIVSAVCHGTVGLVNVKLSNGSYLVKDHKLTSFTDAEEIAVNLMEKMPFALETRLKERGALFQAAPNFSENVVVSDRIITGQNPASATKTAEEIVEKLKLLSTLS